MARWNIQVIDGGKYPRHANMARVFCRRLTVALSARRECSFLKKKKIIELGIRLVGLREAEMLNRRFRKRRYAPNVLTFPTFPDTRSLKRARESSVDLGDIVIAPMVVARDAKKAQNSFYQQFFWMMTHGILHSIGFDHERSAREADRMSRIETAILKEPAIRLLTQKSSRNNPR